MVGTVLRLVLTFVNDDGLNAAKGDTDIAPRKLKGRTACTYCDFKSICAFDTAFAGNKYV